MSRSNVPKSAQVLVTNLHQALSTAVIAASTLTNERLDLLKQLKDAQDRVVELEQRLAEIEGRGVAESQKQKATPRRTTPGTATQAIRQSKRTASLRRRSEGAKIPLTPEQQDAMVTLTVVASGEASDEQQDAPKAKRPRSANVRAGSMPRQMRPTTPAKPKTEPARTASSTPRKAKTAGLSQPKTQLAKTPLATARQIKTTPLSQIKTEPASTPRETRSRRPSVVRQTLLEDKENDVKPTVRITKAELPINDDEAELVAEEERESKTPASAKAKPQSKTPLSVPNDRVTRSAGQKRTADSTPKPSRQSDGASETGVENRFECPFRGCDERFPSFPAIEAHADKFHLEDGYVVWVCSQCSKRLSSWSSARRFHFPTCKKPIDCTAQMYSDVENGAVRVRELLALFRRCHIDGCAYENTLGGPRYLHRHMTVAHDIVPSYACGSCDKAYVGDVHIIRHVMETCKGADIKVSYVDKEKK